MKYKEQIQTSVMKYHSQVVEDYRYLHAHPELSYHEFNTAHYIQKKLASLNIPFRSGIAGTGILGVITGGERCGKTIALRADMDALPIQERNKIPYASKTKQVMHACGHDAHVASLLGVARILSEIRDQLKGTVLLVFQPGEEKHPGGARLMLQDKLFDQIQPDLVIAQHAYTDYPTGTVGFESGVIMAAADEVHIRIKGKGGHGALPHLVHDTVLAASQCIVSMQQVVSRRSNPFSPVVLSFGKFLAMGDTNVIPDEVRIAGTLRTMDEKVRKDLIPIIRSAAIHTAKAHGCLCKIEILDGYPCVANDELITASARQLAIDYLGENNVKRLTKRMTAEDFGFFSQCYPSTFYRFGVQGDSTCGGLHTSHFLIDEESLKTSVGLMTYLAIQLLRFT